MSGDILYILSPSYSGSTLLTFLLAEHPAIATVGELKASAIGNPDQYRCSCGSLLVRCGFWRKIQEGMAHRNHRFSLADFGTHFTGGGEIFGRLLRLGIRHPSVDAAASVLLKTWPPFRTRLSAILKQNLALIDLITKEQQATTFLDASKDPERLMHFQRSALWNIRVVHLIRDGRGISNSYMKHYNVAMNVAAREWLQADLACERVKSFLPGSNVLTVKYEDLCRSPDQIRNQILSFAGLTNGCNGSRAVSEFHILGNNMRLSGLGTIHLDEKWRQELKQEDRRTFAEMAGFQNRENGYQ